MSTMKQPELRKDYIQDKYVIIAPKRGKRPHDTIKPGEKHKKQMVTSCIFCPNNLKDVPSLYKKGDADNWDINIIANKYPAVSLDNDKAYGKQEVVIETGDHTEELEDLSTEHIADLLEAYAVRTKEISKDDKIDYILIFKNDGGVAGASLQHSHSQIFATHFLPPHLFDKSQRQQAYKLTEGNCVYCDVIAKESKDKRLVYKDKNVIAFTPYASMFNYEVWIMPLKHRDNITELTAEERKSFAKILKHVLKKIGQLDLPYNFYFHQVINDNDQHLYMKVVPRGSVWAGVEIGSGLIINPIDPADAAEFYRDGVPK
ncbi:MAG: galactose-1-phosphate uridylyltransferase [Candidatus Komeilibacteria bacterium]|mgnify:FL=1|jgi:UDPglucose--hexose-1-phosphate uridylyltransferase|nr:galactose-1-phosphate uridylyltransferase [Candidatus Komeilibacteria bacterium]